MASGTSNKCANCGSDAAIRCDNCLDAPEYQLGDSGSTAYCNQACLRAHWPTHKLRCQVLERRKKLLRAATVLRTAFLTYREFAHDLDLDKIELRKISPHDEILYLHLRTGPIRARAQRDIFGWHLIIDARIRGAALAYNSFAIAPCLLGGLIEKLLDGERAPSCYFKALNVL